MEIITNMTTAMLFFYRKKSILLSNDLPYLYQCHKRKSTQGHMTIDISKGCARQRPDFCVTIYTINIVVKGINRRPNRCQPRFVSADPLKPFWVKDKFLNNSC